MTTHENAGQIQWIANGHYLCRKCGYGLSIEQVVENECEWAAPGFKPTAEQRRYRAIGIVMRWYSQGREMVYDMTSEIADEIENLVTLGRTDRWRGMIATWAHEVRNADSAATAHWALAQYSIYAGHAAGKK